MFDDTNSILDQFRMKESKERYNNILFSLYELKKEITYLQYELKNYRPYKLEKICMEKAYNYVYSKFNEFKMPKELMDFYK